MLEKAPLGVALLAQTPSLSVVVRLDGRFFKHVRMAKNSVNRP
jgi:hypothetical protein